MTKKWPKKSKQYVLWKSIKGRCYTPTASSYKYYGGRGIKVSDEFVNNSKAFMEYIKTIDNYETWLNDTDMVYSLDRIDGSKDYERGNLRFADRLTQDSNKRLRKNATGFKSVCKNGNRYRCQLTRKGVLYHIGTFDTPEEAAAAYENWVLSNPDLEKYKISKR